MSRITDRPWPTLPKDPKGLRAATALTKLDPVRFLVPSIERPRLITNGRPDCVWLVLGPDPDSVMVRVVNLSTPLEGPDRFLPPSSHRLPRASGRLHPDTLARLEEFSDATHA